MRLQRKRQIILHYNQIHFYINNFINNKKRANKNFENICYVFDNHVITSHIKTLNNTKKNKHRNPKMSKCHKYINHRKYKYNTYNIMLSFTNNQSRWPDLGLIFFLL